MKALGKLACFAMLVVLFGSPVMACLAPDAQLNEQEKACCRRMAQQCGNMGMAGHSCCQKIIQTQQVAVTQQSATAGHIVLQARLSVAETVPLAAASPAIDIRPTSGRHPPPETTSQVLRI